VTVVDNLVTGFRWAIPSGALFCQGDIADGELITGLLEHHQIGAILHFAGSVVVPESVTDPLKYYRNNTAGTLALIECAIACRVNHLVFSSSAAVYGIPSSVRVAEDAPTSPVNPYGTSKLMSELMLRDAAAAHPLNFCALRYFNVAGADPDCRTGQSTPNATHLIKVAVEAALGRREEVIVFGQDYDTRDGTGIRDYIHVTDLASAHVAALDKLVTSPDQSFILNCGYGRGYSVLEILDAVDQVVGQKVSRRFSSRRPGDPPALVADNRKILGTLQWAPHYADLHVMISHALAWERKLSKQ